MHPTYTSDRAGDCPICGMRLVPIKDDGAAPSTAFGPVVPGRTAIVITPEKRQAIGVTFSTVEKRKLTQTLRLPGTVDHDETRSARISPRFGGWVRSLQVNFTGQEVTKGDPLFTVYSPELFASENEYLLAFQNNRRLTNSPTAELGSHHLLESARRRLELLGIDEAEIRHIETTGRASEELQIHAPLSGHVTAKTAVAGKSFMSGETLYEIAELSHLWLRAFVFESELSRVRVGQEARVIFPYLAHQTVTSLVAFINPHIDPQTRRGEVRLELSNPDHTFRPDMWAEVEIDTESAELLSVPASAVIDTGTRYIAFVEGADNHLEPRELKLGARTDDYYEVLEGAKEGERVVSRALFLVDSESQLKAALAGMDSGAAPAH
jgi:Cu(I)/Ag(I) efflux system membrane fusion protein